MARKSRPPRLTAYFTPAIFGNAVGNAVAMRPPTSRIASKAFSCRGPPFGNNLRATGSSGNRSKPVVRTAEKRVFLRASRRPRRRDDSSCNTLRRTPAKPNSCVRERRRKTDIRQPREAHHDRSKQPHFHPLFCSRAHSSDGKARVYGQFRKCRRHCTSQELRNAAPALDARGPCRPPCQHDGLTCRARVSTPRLLERFIRAAAWLALGAVLLPLNGCAVAALPCRLTSATLKIIPVVGHAAASPFDMCSSAID